MIGLTRPDGSRVFVARGAVGVVWEPAAYEHWTAGTRTVLLVSGQTVGVTEELGDVLRQLESPLPARG